MTLGCGGESAAIKGHFYFYLRRRVLWRTLFLFAAVQGGTDGKTQKKEQKNTINLQNAVYKITVL